MTQQDLACKCTIRLVDSADSDFANPRFQPCEGGRGLKSMSLAEKVIAIHDSLELAGVEHAFSGALALAYHVAEPRATRDIDLDIAVLQDGAKKVFNALPRHVRWMRRRHCAGSLSLATASAATRWLRQERQPSSRCPRR